MSISAVVSTNPTVVAQVAQPKSTASSSINSYAAIAANQGLAPTYTSDQVKAFFATNPDQEQIANQAAALGLTENQILSAMQTGGYAGADKTTLKAGIDSFMSAHKDAYAWSANGAIADISKSTAAIASTVDWSRATQDQLTAQSATLTAQGVTICEQADRARACGVDERVLDTFLDSNRVAHNADQYPSGLTGIIDKNGRNLSIKDINAYFATNPSNAAMAADWGPSGLGLNDNQVQHLMAIKHGTQYVPTMNIGRYDYAGNYVDPYYGSDAFTGGGTDNGTPTGNRYGNSTAKLGAWTPPPGWGTSGGAQATASAVAATATKLNAQA